MSWNYLQGKKWAQITRDERFFCQHLYHLILRERGVNFFVEKLNELTELTGHKLNLDATANWEIGYEVCFYRDLRFHLEEGGKWQSVIQKLENIDPLSLKRTFDLCLFSEETVVIIEAKAQQGFDSKQITSCKKDKELVRKLLGTEGLKHVKLVGLASSKYLTDKCKANLLQHQVDDAPLFDALIDWRQLEEHFGFDPVLKRAGFDPDLRRADDIYPRVRQHLTLEQILHRIRRKETFFIRCKGGRTKFMDALGQDLSTLYETSTRLVERNDWFSTNEVSLGASPT